MGSIVRREPLPAPIPMRDNPEGAYFRPRFEGRGDGACSPPSARIPSLGRGPAPQRGADQAPAVTGTYVTRAGLEAQFGAAVLPVDDVARAGRSPSLPPPGGSGAESRR